MLHMLTNKPRPTFASTQRDSGLETSGVGACGAAIKFLPSTVAMVHILFRLRSTCACCLQEVTDTCVAVIETRH